MAIQRLSLSNIATEIKRIVGFPGQPSVDTPWSTDTDLYRIINGYGQRLAMRCAQVLGDKKPHQPLRAPRFDMYRTRINSEEDSSEDRFSVTTGSSQVLFPENLDEIISIWDLEYERTLDKVEDVDRWHHDLRRRKPGPPEFYELNGITHAVDPHRRFALLYPAPPAGFLPSLHMNYWRVPSVMAGTDPANEYPDADPKYDWLWVYGPAMEILRPSPSGL